MTGLRITDPDVADLPPSCKLVYLVLQEAGPCTQAEIRMRAQLPDNTCRDAIDRLLETDVIERRIAADARQEVYDL